MITFEKTKFHVLLFYSINSEIHPSDRYKFPKPGL